MSALAAIKPDEESSAQLLAIAQHDDERLQVAATWILKQWSDQGVPLVESCIDELVPILGNASHWEVQLHLLQILAEQKIPAGVTRALKKILDRLIVNGNKLVRAWTYGAFAALADQHPTHRKPVLAILNEAINEQAASVRAESDRSENATLGPAKVSEGKSNRLAMAKTKGICSSTRASHKRHYMTCVLSASQATGQIFEPASLSIIAKTSSSSK
ncbi:MAG: hypothetical protein R3C03_14465 [Pirellulaceae bacterium]